MSEGPTKNLEQKYDTNPMLETILSEVRAGFERVEARLDRIEAQLDRTTSVAHETRAELREFKAQMKEHFPSLIK
jgi:peptidoglycan hydrolase CwlO-like protein